jgi:phage tail sheath protein FI
MSTVMKTPGVYIVEKNAFPNSVVEVATAVPAFIGYTEKADNKGTPLANKPWRISSMAEYVNYFGVAPKATFKLTLSPTPGANPNAASTGTTTGTTASPAPAADANAASTGTATGTTATPATAPKAPTADWDLGKKFYLYYSMQLFFENGGGPCYIVSVGTYKTATNTDTPITEADLSAGIDSLLKEQEPTMVVIPDAVLLERGACIKLQQAALKHCGLDTRSRVAILDVYNGFNDRQTSDPDKDNKPSNCIDNFRNLLGTDYLDFGAAYYPWLKTSVVDDSDLGYQNISNLDALKTGLQSELDFNDDGKDPSTKKASKQAVLNVIGGSLDPKQWTPDLLNSALVAMSPMFKQIRAAIQSMINLLPPSGAIAGIYTMVDDLKGVWKAPANVTIADVISPTVSISNADQEDLNVTPQGKSINAIRSFVGEGTLVWGARTLDGNSLDWRYINVRRTMIMLEQSIKLATKAYVFENNVSTTWVTIKSMIQNFLTSIWKRGGLAGASPEDAFAVFCGLGETMTADDILEGILRVTVLVAVTRPAEFIEITFQQQMQKS